MEEFTLLRDLVVISAVAVAVVAVLVRLGVPTIAGFIVAGVLAGPRGLRLVADMHQVEALAELGVVLLLFGIGLELSLARIRRLWRLVLIGGTLQVALTTGATALIALALGIAWPVAVFLGFLVTVSSTAIVLRALDARGELEAPHGRLTLGILIYQDLCVVPMILVIPLLSGQGESPVDILLTLLKAAAVLTGVVIAARLVVPRALHLIAQTRQRNLFVLTVFLICLGTAWIASLAGVSLALGAFLAGLVVSGSEYRTQALSDLIPIREVLTSVFFVSVGMLLDPRLLWAHLGPVVALLVAIIVGKFAVVLLTGAVMRLPLRAVVLAAGALAQIGEFSFILGRAGAGAGLLEPALLADVTAATILSMLVTPLMLMAGPHLAAGAGRLRELTGLLQVRTAEESERLAGLGDHVIIAGFGVAGQELAHSLRQCGVAYAIVEMNPETVRQAVNDGEPAYYGDVTSTEVLESLGAHHARELALVVNDPGAVFRAVAAARRIAPDLHIVVRTRYVLDVPAMYAAGASVVVPAELEAAVKVAGYVLQRHGIAEPQIEEQLARIRARRDEVEA